MQNRWSIEMIAELAFMQEPMRFYGYGMEKGIILIADDEESAIAIKSMLEAHMDAVGVRLRGRKECQPLNYQMGVHVYNRLDDERKVMDFLEEQEFLPIVIASGMSPEILIGRGYALRCTAIEKDFMEAEKRYKSFSGFTKRNVSVVCDLIKQISKYSDMIEDPHKKYQKYQKMVKNFMTVILIWDSIYEEHGMEKEKIGEEIEQLKKPIWSSIETMERNDGTYDVQDPVKKCFIEQASKGKMGISQLGEDSATDEIENHILYDDDFYYVTDSTLRTICAPLLKTVSFVKLKNEMVASGMVDCNDGNLKNFTKKKLIWRSFGWQERVRFVWIKKEALMTKEGLLLEDIGEDTKC